MELRPNLKRLYTTLTDLENYTPVVIPLGFSLIDGSEIELDDTTYYSAIIDFGPDSVDGWLRKLIGLELGIGQ